MPKTKAKKGSSKRQKAAPKRVGASKNGTKKTTRAAKAPKRAKKVAAARVPVDAGASRTNATAGVRPVPAKDTRQLVQERKFLRSESRWLQKALFALSKAEDDQQKLAEVRGERHQSMPVRLNGTTHDLGDVTDSLRDSVMERLEGLRAVMLDEHALMG